ncbi:adenylate/guanylate cyclase domain-containing protein [Leptospira sp. 96542]|nr:adenylate/guanylate cyclase domain-containing protein [Leptospira sp. 96542]
MVRLFFDIWKTTSHSTFRKAMSGTLVLLGCFLFIPELDENAKQTLPVGFAIFSCVFVILLPFYPTYRLVRGKSTLTSWSFWFFWTVVFPWAMIIGHFGAYMPEYLPIFYILFVGGGGVGVGIMPKWTYITNTIGMVVVFFISLYFIHPELFFSPPLYLLSSSAIVILSSYWIGVASDYYILRNEVSARTIRSSRRDKRLVAEERLKSEKLLLNILPVTVVEELKLKGVSPPVHIDSATVLFTDFEGFTKIAETMPPNQLVKELDYCFSYFDSLIERHKLEKLKTIGDSYMCVGGIPTENQTHAIDCVLTALEIQTFMNRLKLEKQNKNLPYWQLRIGIHSGPLVAGVIGEKKFAYDVWGDTVNTASRCESSGIAGQINISLETKNLVDDFFKCKSRGKVPAKHKGDIDMYIVEGIRPELSEGGQGFTPNERFYELYNRLV